MRRSTKIALVILALILIAVAMTVIFDVPFPGFPRDEREESIQKTRKEALSRVSTTPLKQKTEEALEEINQYQATQEKLFQEKEMIARSHLIYAWGLLNSEEIKEHLKLFDFLPLDGQRINSEFLLGWDYREEAWVVKCLLDRTVCTLDALNNADKDDKVRMVKVLVSITPEIADQNILRFVSEKLKYLQDEKTALENLHALWLFTYYKNIEEYFEDHTKLPLDGKEEDDSKIFLQHNYESEIAVYYKDDTYSTFECTLEVFEAESRPYKKTERISALMLLSPGIAAGNLNKILPEDLKIK